MPDLHVCVVSDDVEKLTRLIAEGADLEALDNDGATALYLAAAFCSTEMVRALLAAGASPNTPRSLLVGKDDTSPLIVAAESHSGLPVLHLLLARGADVNYRRSVSLGRKDDSSALFVAARYRHWWNVKALVEAGADVVTPPTFAFNRRHNLGALGVVASIGSTEMVEIMLEKGADVSHVCTFFHGRRDDRTALHFACRSFGADAGKMRALLEAGADPNELAMTSHWRTPLLMAVSTPVSVAAMSALVVAGAYPFAETADGDTVVEALGRQDILFDSRPSSFDLTD